MQILKTLNLALAFLLELAMLASIGYWAYQQGKSPILKWVLLIILPLAAMILWGIFAAPKSQYRLDFNARILFEIVMFSLAAFLLYKAGQSTLSLCFAALSIVSITIAFIYKQ